MSPICPYCEGPIDDYVEGELGTKMMFYRCAGACGHIFYPPWPERQWCEADSRPVPEELTTRYRTKEVTPAAQESPAQPTVRRVAEFVTQYAPRAIGAMLGGAAVIFITFLIEHDRHTLLLIGSA